MGWDARCLGNLDETWHDRARDRQSRRVREAIWRFGLSSRLALRGAGAWWRWRLFRLFFPRFFVAIATHLDIPLRNQGPGCTLRVAWSGGPEWVVRVVDLGAEAAEAEAVGDDEDAGEADGAATVESGRGAGEVGFSGAGQVGELVVALGVVAAGRGRCCGGGDGRDAGRSVAG